MLDKSPLPPFAKVGSNTKSNSDTICKDATDNSMSVCDKNNPTQRNICVYSNKIAIISEESHKKSLSETDNAL